MRRVRRGLAVGIGALCAAGVAAAAPGDLDTTFSEDGKWQKPGVTDPAGAFATDVALQPDGSMMVVGEYSLQDWLFSLVAADGSREIDVLRADPGSTVGGALAVARQPDGKFVAVGTSGSGDNVTMEVIRVTAPAVFQDTSFGTAGRVPIALGFARDVLVQSDGKIVVVGDSVRQPAATSSSRA